MKIVKIVITLLLLVVFTISLVSCSMKHENTSSEPHITPKDVKNRVISEATEYLKENYPDDEFTFVSGASPNWSDKYYKIGFTSKKYDNQKFIVYGQSTDKKNKDGLTVYEYYDNYYQYYMNRDAEKYFYDIAQQYLGEDIVVKVSVSKGIGFAKSIEKHKNFEENLKNNNIDPFVYIFYNDEIKNKSESFKKILYNLFEKKIYVSVTFLYSNKLDEISCKYANEIVENQSNYCIEKKYYTTYDGIIEEN